MKNQATVKSSFTVEEFRTVLNDVYDKNKTRPEKDFIIWTGAGGKAQIDHSLELEASRLLIESLMKDLMITASEKDSLLEMLNSSDWENFYLAKQIIDVRWKKKV